MSSIDPAKRQKDLEDLESIFIDERAPPLPPERGTSQLKRNRSSDLGDALRDSLVRLTKRRTTDSRLTALVPASSISGRALAIVIIIMTFLASITAGAVELISSASSGWSAEISREMTIQVRPRKGRDLEADIAAAVNIAKASSVIANVQTYTKAQSERLLEPWLGTGLPFEQMPVPRIIILKLAERPPAASAIQIRELAQTLGSMVPTASLDDHRQWSSRLSTMAGAMVLVGVFILALVLAATALAIGFATRGAMAGTREIVNVLHLVGAEDRFIADEFQRHFLKLGSRGSAIGGFLALAAFFLAGKANETLRATPQGDQIEALFGSFGLGFRGYAAICAIMVLVVALTTIVTRVTVYRNLRGLD